MPEKYKKLIQRYGHGTASLTVNSDCVEVILFGGCDNRHFVMADTTILRFGELVELKYGNFLIGVKLVKEASSFLFLVHLCYRAFYVLLVKLLLWHLLFLLSMLYFIVCFPIFQL